MNKKGFTLIELLAVIVILAIIALIATPIILGIINDARESSKKRSSELVYTGVGYAYATSMYQLKNAGEEVSLKSIYDNFNVENVTKKSGTTLDNNAKEFELQTAEGVTCTVSENANGYQVKCGTEEDDDAYLSKLVQTTTEVVTGPDYYSWTKTTGTIGGKLPADKQTTASELAINSDYIFYLGLGTEDGETVSEAYVCFTPNKNYCLKGGVEDADIYAANQKVIREAFKDVANTNVCSFGDRSSRCYTSSLDIQVSSSGYVYANIGDFAGCTVYTNGNFSCFER